jgi:hypothetical protein
MPRSRTIGSLRASLIVHRRKIKRQLFSALRGGGERGWRMIENDQTKSIFDHSLIEMV